MIPIKCSTVGCHAESDHTLVWAESGYREPICAPCARYYAKITGDHEYSIYPGASR